MSKNNWVRTHRRPSCFIEPIRTLNHEKGHFLSIKAPIISSEDKVIAVQGVSLSIDHTKNFNFLIKKLMLAADNFNYSIDSNTLLKLMVQLSQIKENKFQNSAEKSGFNYETITFSFREAQCLHYFLNNYSADETAKILCLSRKTIETHLANIKIKLNCNKRSEVTKKAQTLGFIELMFMKF